MLSIKKRTKLRPVDTILPLITSIIIKSYLMQNITIITIITINTIIHAPRITKHYYRVKYIYYKSCLILCVPAELHGSMSLIVNIIY